MALRVARGLFRLWLVLSVLWIGGAYGQTEPMQTETIKRYDAEGLETLLPPPFGPTNKAWLGREHGGPYRSAPRTLESARGERR